ncbi:hypothetical protein [Phytomonospora endophytica]|uniref:Tetratricopeptide (TPR) repeat protein n=1 Tax=Phytomonospora endophytica TaxID=714109 RepID=A0A841FF62_9ACTN|nr:hypothetical protein [Phytomonospora endophytica]MBB6034215.1 tetratricopeptide (TPR) repeat protein [Phytomonospora endophytica]GIG66608.1 hypothetical protein Pen01_29030 [Phytomonospora endophytica]
MDSSDHGRALTDLADAIGAAGAGDGDQAAAVLAETLRRHGDDPELARSAEELGQSRAPTALAAAFLRSAARGFPADGAPTSALESLAGWFSRNGEFAAAADVWTVVVAGLPDADERRPKALRALVTSLAEAADRDGSDVDARIVTAVEDLLARTGDLARYAFAERVVDGQIARLLAADRLDEAIGHSHRLRDRYGLVPGADPGDAAILHDRHAHLLGLAARPEESFAASERAIALAESVRPYPFPRLPGLLRFHSNRLLTLGREEEAIAVAFGAVEAAEHGDSPLETAYSLSDAAAKLINAGHAEAADWSRRAVDAWLELDADGVGEAPADLAIALMNQRVLWLRNGAHHEARECSETAVRRLERAVHGDTSLRPALGKALTAHCADLEILDETTRMECHAAEAVNLYTELDARAELAGALDLHARALWAEGRASEALARSTRAQALYTELLASDRERLRRTAAESLARHATLLDGTGRATEAVACSAEAVRLLDRDDVDWWSRAFTHAEHAGRLLGLGRAEEGMTHSLRALAIGEEHAADGDPDAGHVLLGLLTDLARDLVAHTADGLGHSARTVAFAVDLAATDPAVYGGLATRAIENHAAFLSDDDRPGEALDHVRRAIALCTELVDADRSRHLGRLAELRDTEVHHLGLAGRRPEAAAAAEEALRTWREAVALAPGLRQTAARAIAWIAWTRGELGDPARAATIAEEALRLAEDLTGGPELAPEIVTLHRDLARLRLLAGDRAGAVGPALDSVALARATNDLQLRESLSAFVQVLVENGRAAEAVEPAAECLTLSRGLGGPHDLANAIDAYAETLAETGRHAEALVSAAEAVPMWEELGATTDLAWSLSQRAKWLAAMGVAPEEPLAMSARAVTLLRDAHAEDPDLREDLAHALTEHARRLAAAGEYGEARAAATAAVGHWRALSAELPAPYEPGLRAALNVAAGVGAGEESA